MALFGLHWSIGELIFFFILFLLLVFRGKAQWDYNNEGPEI